MISLYYTPNSPYARKVRVVLAEKAIPYTPEPLTFAPMDRGPIYPADYESRVPHLRVPLLRDGELELFESNAILEYLFATYPERTGGGEPPLTPAMTRPERHWADLMILVTIETALDSALNLFQLTRFGLPAGEQPYLRREAGRVQSCLDWLEARATPEGFAPGSFSVMDLNLVCALDWLDFRRPAEWRGRPNLERLMALHGERPTLAETRPA